MRRSSPVPVSRRLVAAVVLAVLSLGVAGLTLAGGAHQVPTFTPTSAAEITNIDILRSQIKNYYGDPTGTGTVGADSNYAQEASGVAADGARWLSSGWRGTAPMKAIVLDVDDTTLVTWNYEIFSNWAFNPTTNGQFVTDERFPAVPGMVDMVNGAAAEGYAIIFITGRPAGQEAATLGNLTDSDAIGVNAGYPHPTTLVNGEDGLFTKPAIADYPQYLKDACADELALNKSCTTIHYKSATRAHIESLGYEIVANFGDQFSDLKGGFADRTFKLPNPNYYLP